MRRVSQALLALIQDRKRTEAWRVHDNPSNSSTWVETKTPVSGSQPAPAVSPNTAVSPREKEPAFLQTLGPLCPHRHSRFRSLYPEKNRLPADASIPPPGPLPRAWNKVLYTTGGGISMPDSQFSVQEGKRSWSSRDSGEAGSEGLLPSLKRPPENWDKEGKLLSVCLPSCRIVRHSHTHLPPKQKKISTCLLIAHLVQLQFKISNCFGGTCVAPSAKRWTLGFS